jgi:Ni2+-binding GTPase involved in maturation of urease and hydrogenase
MSKLRVGVAGPVGSGKTALVLQLCLLLLHHLFKLEGNLGPSE